MRILVAEDDEVARRILIRHLSNWRYEIIQVSDGQAAFDLLMDPLEHPPIAILDWMIPNIDGAEVCRMLRARPDAPFIYVILLSGRDTTQDIVSGLDAGADDYLIKPFDPHELRSRIRAGERIVSLQKKLAQANAELRTLSLVDNLTDRMNRPAILQRLAQELSRSTRQRTSIAAVKVEIDGIADIVSSYGRDAADEVIREFANRLGERLRGYDAVGRYAGQEFLCVLPGITWETCEPVANRIREAVCEKPIRIGSRIVSVTASLGLAWVGERESCGDDELIGLADRMLEQAKTEGGNRVVTIPFSEVRNAVSTEERV